MQLLEGKQKFIQAWGVLGTNWGINKTMAQIHALLLIASEPLCQDMIIRDLGISVGNASVNLRALLDWGLIYKISKNGCRKDFYIAEKDMWKIVQQVIIQRKKRELEPMLKIADEMMQITDDDPDAIAFKEMMSTIKLFSGKADAALTNLTRAEANWLTGTFLKLVK